MIIASGEANARCHPTTTTDPIMTSDQVTLEIFSDYV